MFACECAGPCRASCCSDAFSIDECARCTNEAAASCEIELKECANDGA
jgi:hypothetical protein